MAREQLDIDTFNGTISSSSTETLEIDTSRGDDIALLIDDGTTGGAPSQYSLTQNLYVPQIDSYQFYDEVTESTARSWLDSAWASEMQFEFTNTSGSDSTYRITAISYRSM